MTLVGSGVIVLPSLQELEELLGAPFLEETHERALDGLHLRAGHLGDLAIAVDEAARDLLELEVARHVRVHEDARELAGRDDELGDEVDGIVAVATQLGRRGLVRPELAIELYGARVGVGDGSSMYRAWMRTWVRFKLALSPP